MMGKVKVGFTSFQDHIKILTKLQNNQHGESPEALLYMRI